MKIIHCIGNLKGGGAETQLGIFVSNTYGQIDNVVVSYAASADISYTHYSMKQASPIFSQWISFYKICKDEKPDIIHIWLPAVFHIYCIPSFFFRIPKILGVRSVYKLDSLKRLLHLLFYAKGQHLVSNTKLQNHRGCFKSLFATKNFNYIPNAIKYEFTQNDQFSKTSSDNKSIFRLLFVGRLIKDKNLPMLISALSILKSRNYKMTFVGDGNERENLESLVKDMGLSYFVHFEGYTDDIKSYYLNSDALILPSIREGMPNVIFEAAQLQTLLLLSDIPQHKSWFTDDENALFFNPRDHHDMAKVLMKAMEMKIEKRNLLIEESLKVIKPLTRERYINNYINLYQQIIRK